jgi:hypothetical protein
MRLGFAAVLICVLAGSAHADDDHLIYVEAGGKAGAYGVGYELSITPRLALGAVASYAVLRDQHIATGSPYLHATILRGRHNALFGELGLVLAYSKIPSPVMTWDGMSESGAGGAAALGWERTFKHGFLTRVQGSVLVGEGGAAPWFGISFGWRP